MKAFPCIALLLASATLGSNAADFRQSLDALTAASPAARALMLNAESEGAEAASQAILPNPEAEGEYLWAPAGETNRWGAGISWGLEWPGVYAARKRAARNAATVAELSALSELFQLRIQLAEAMTDYILASRKEELIGRRIADMDRLAKLTEFSLANGQATALDKSKVDVERARLNVLLLEIRDAVAQARGAVAEIAGPTASEVLATLEREFPSAPAAPLETYLEAARRTPTLLLAQARMAQAESAAGVARTEGLPGFKVGYRHAFEDGNHFNGGSLGVDIPLFGHRERNRAAKAAQAAAEADAEAQREALVQQVETIHGRLLLADRTLSELQGAVNTSEALEMLDKMLEHGRINMLDYLRERAYYLEVEMELLEVKAERARLMAGLDLLL